MIQTVIAGITILRIYSTTAPVLALSYLLIVPDIKFEDMTPADRESMLALGWFEHPGYKAYAYLTVT